MLGGWTLSVHIILIAASSDRNLNEYIVSVEKHNSVILPCNISSSFEEDDKVMLVLWFKDGSRDPCYRLEIYRRGAFPNNLLKVMMLDMACGT